MQWLRHRRFLTSVVIAVLAAFAHRAPALAQSSQDTGVISITVIDMGDKQPLPDARILLLGATQASALTNRNGVVKYTDVPSGIYRVRVVKSGFAGSTSAQFEILGNKEVDVDVNLVPQVARSSAPAGATPSDASGIKVIGRVSAKVSITTRDVDSESAIRKVSDSLTAALSKIAGVDVTQNANDPDAAQTISLNGHDESQTAVTLDGIPLGAPGSAVDLRSLNTDLFGGASVSFAAQAGALGGAVNFRTLQPTQTWVTRFSTSYGTFAHFNYELGETGSFGKLGIALLHTLRESNNPLTFNTYADQSGLTYAHAGESSTAGNFLKLRYALDDRTTLNVTALQNDRGTSSLCTQDVTLVPCGIGPGNSNAAKFQFMYGTAQRLIGEVTTSVSAYVNANDTTVDDALRYIDGTSSPLVSTTKTLSRGIAFLSTVNAGRSTWTLNGSSYNSATDFAPLRNASPFLIGSRASTSAQTLALSDVYKIDDRLAVGPTLSLAGTNGAGSSLLGGLSGTWRPTGSDTYAASVSVGSSQPAAGLIRTYSDPASARFNCAAGTANVNGPGDLPGKQSAISYAANWSHAWGFGSLNIDIYRQSQANQLINAQIVASGLGFTTNSPYVQALQAYYASPYSCGPGAILSPANVYISEPIGDTTRLYSGFTVSGRVALGPHLVAIPSYQTNGATITMADARLAALNSTTIIGAQIPGRPVHRGNLTLDGEIPRAGLELLANLQYTGANNGQNLDPYALLSIGASHALGVGRLAFLETNVFDTESGALSSLAFAQPIRTSGSGQLVAAANPNPPRQFSVTYSFNTGARAGAGGARPSRNAAAAAGAAQTLAAGVTPSAARARGLGAFTPYPPPAGVDPLGVADKRDSCRPDDAFIAQPILGQLRVAVAAFEAGKPLPAVDGLALVPHGSAASGSWYFEVRPNLLRPPGRSGFGERGPDAGDQRGRSGAGQPDGPPPGAGAGGSPPDGGVAPLPGAGQAPASIPSGSTALQHVTVAPDTGNAAAATRPTPNPAARAAFQKFRATLSCAYFSALTQAEVEAAGYTAFVGRNGLGYAPRSGLFAVRAPDLGTGGGSLKH